MGRRSREKQARRQALTAPIKKAAADIARRVQAGTFGDGEAERRVAERSRSVRSLLPGPVPRLPAPLDWLNQMIPEVVPAGWQLTEARADGLAFTGPPPALLKFIFSGATEEDGRRWLHGSVTAAGRPPSWDEVVAVKELFLGPASLAVILIPPRSEWVNINPHCHHFWVCADRRPTPDFTRGMGTI